MTNNEDTAQDRGKLVPDKIEQLITLAAHTLGISALVGAVIATLVTLASAIHWSLKLHDRGLMLSILQHMSKGLTLFVIIGFFVSLIFPQLMVGFFARYEDDYKQAKKTTTAWYGQVWLCLQGCFVQMRSLISGRQADTNTKEHGGEGEGKNSCPGSLQGIEQQTEAEQKEEQKNDTQPEPIAHSDPEKAIRKGNAGISIYSVIALAISLLQTRFLTLHMSGNFILELYALTAIAFAWSVAKFKISRVGTNKNFIMILMFAFYGDIQSLVFVDLIINNSSSMVAHSTLLQFFVVFLILFLTNIGIVLVFEFYEKFLYVVFFTVIVWFLFGIVDGFWGNEVIAWYGGVRDEKAIPILYDTAHPKSLFTDIEGLHYYNEASVSKRYANLKKGEKLPGYWCSSRIYILKTKRTIRFACQSNQRKIHLWGVVQLPQAPRPDQYSYGLGMIEPYGFKQVMHCARPYSKTASNDHGKKDSKKDKKHPQTWIHLFCVVRNIPEFHIKHSNSKLLSVIQA
jgi:hypothetical protein